MTNAEVLQLLRDEIQLAGSQIKWAKQNNLAQQYVSQVLRGEIKPGKKILNALGLSRVTSYTLQEP